MPGITGGADVLKKPSNNMEMTLITNLRTAMARKLPVAGYLALLGVLLIPSASFAQSSAPAVAPRFAYLAPALDLPFWRIVGKGVSAEVQSAGGTLTTYDSHNDAATQLKNAQDAIAQGVAGIVISPTDSSSTPSVLALAKRSHVPVSIAGIGTTSGDYVSFVGSDDEKGAYEVGKKLASVMTQRGWQKGGYGIVSISLARQNGKLRTEGFRRAMKEAGIKEVALNQMQRYTADETFKFVQDMLTANPDMRGLFIETDTPTLGADRALRIAHKGSDVALVAFDGIPEFIDMIRNGSLIASGMQQPYLMGQQSVRTLVDAMHGKTPEKQVTVPIELVSKENLDAKLPVIRQTVLGGETK